MKKGFTKSSPKIAKKAATNTTMLAKKMSPGKLRAHISENLRQSFCAEGVCYSRTEWNRVSLKLSRKK